MPPNYRYVGPILDAMPDARVIHIRRDPLDVALSMWRNLFLGEFMNFTYQLDGMAHSANLYARYMAHWRAGWGDRFLEIDYEDLVSDIVATSRKMADFCGLEWDEAMAMPHKTQARVRTASIAQVRAGVSTGSVAGWRAVEDHMRPFLDGLDPELWPELSK